MKKIGVAILGLGTVGGGTYKLLVSHKDFYEKTQGIEVSIEAVLEKDESRLKALEIDKSIVAARIAEVVANPGVDIVVETLGGLDPAKAYVLAALESGKTVVTSNLELISKYWYELESVAKKYHAGLYIGASCVGGIPVVRTLMEGTQANEISSIVGVIDLFRNRVYTEMSDNGLSYDEAVSKVKSVYSETEAGDNAYKLSILSSYAFNTKVPVENISFKDADRITQSDIIWGKKLGYVLKPVAVGKSTENGIEVRLNPAFISTSNPLSTVSGEYNGIKIVGDCVGKIILIGKGEGENPSASAIVSDVLYAATHVVSKYAPFKNTELPDKHAKFSTEETSRYFMRFTVANVIKAVSKLTAAFSKYNVSILDIKHEALESGEGTVALVTHTAKESAIKKAIEKLASSNLPVQTESIIKVEV